MKKHLYKSLCLALLIICSISCTQEELETFIPSTPNLITPLENEVDVNLAPLFSWESSTDNFGDDNLITYDVYIGLDDNPQVLISEGQSSTSLNAYPNNVIGLSTGHIYYWKVVAKDSNGNENYLSPVWSFTITEFPLVTIEGETYFTTKIGNNRWLTKNLNASDHLIGNSSCYDDETFNCSAYGRLYDWNAAVNIAEQIPGWHLPTDDEWKDLELAVGMGEDVIHNYGWRGTDEGTKLLIGGNSGFGARLGGFYEVSNGIAHSRNLGNTARFWTASQYLNNPPFGRRLNHLPLPDYISGVYRSHFFDNLRFSVRLVKD